MCNSAVKIQGPSLLLLELLLLLFIYLVAGRKSISFYHRLFLSFFLTSYQKLVFWALHLFLGTRLSHFMPFNKWSLVSNCVRVFTSIITQEINSEAGRKKNLRFCCRISRSAYISVPCVTLNITHGPTKVEENIRWLKIKNFFWGDSITATRSCSKSVWRVGQVMRSRRYRLKLEKNIYNNNRVMSSAFFSP